MNIIEIIFLIFIAICFIAGVIGVIVEKKRTGHSWKGQKYGE